MAYCLFLRQWRCEEAYLIHERLLIFPSQVNENLTVWRVNVNRNFEIIPYIEKYHLNEWCEQSTFKTLTVIISDFMEASKIFAGIEGYSFIFLNYHLSLCFQMNSRCPSFIQIYTVVSSTLMSCRRFQWFDAVSTYFS